MISTEELTTYVSWMRMHGVSDLTAGIVSIKLGSAPRVDVEGETVLDIEEPEAVQLERKRARYEKLLGRQVSAEEARDHLP